MLATDLEGREALAAAGGGAEKRRYVRRMFSEIAPSYDLLNHVLSFNVDRLWRRAALRELGWERRPEGTYLDLCAGTLDVGAQLLRTPGFRGHVVGADFAEPMLRAGAGKAPPGRLSPAVGDALELPLRSGSVSGAVVAFGIRNVADLEACCREVLRVLAPGGRFVILEFSTPRSRLVRLGYGLYSRFVLPAVGRLVSGHRTAYTYLPESIARFPEAYELAERVGAAGYASVRWRPLTFGIAALHVAEKQR